MLKKYLKSYLYLFSSIFILTLIISIINYFYPFQTKIINIIIPIISILVSTVILGKNTKSKAYLEGIKFTSVYIIISIIFSIMIKNPLSLKLVICYLLQLLSGIIGSTIGINLKKNI